MTAVMLLGAGHGTRLSPLTDECPKALVPIGDRPVIAHQIERLRANLREPTLIVNAHHLSQQLVEFLNTYDPNIRAIVEPTLLGTGGGVRGALKYASQGPLLVVNVDVLSRLNYSIMLGKVTEQSILLAIVPKAVGCGTVGVDERGRIVRLRSETFGAEFAGGDYLGVAAIGSERLSQLPASGCLVEDYMLPLLRAGAVIDTHAEQTEWLDIGTLSNYAAANFEWLRQRAVQAWSSPTASVSDQVELRDAIVGSDAQVDGQGLLERVIIWPSAHLDAPLSRAIVTSAGVIARF